MVNPEDLDTIVEKGKPQCNVNINDFIKFVYDFKTIAKH